MTSRPTSSSSQQPPAAPAEAATERPAESVDPTQAPAAVPSSVPTAGQAAVGVVGMAVMGRNLARNLARHGHVVALYNRTPARTDAVVAEHGSEGTFLPAADLGTFVASLARPRRIIVMVQAGPGTDAVIDSLVPLLEEGDIVVDGGNAHYADTRRREQRLRAEGLHFVGAGISGGEVGALEGPSIMPGGSPESYAALGPVLESIAATVDGEPCCAHMGPDGAGHFVKMVHNGIEYADMQFIGEAYDLLRAGGVDPGAAADIFRGWNEGDLDSYLVEVTAEVLAQRDARTGGALVDSIVDAAGQKGTGSWTVQAALELGVPVNAIAESVFARSASSHPELRTAARAALTGPARDTLDAGGADLVEDVRQTLWAAKVVAYAQGLHLIRVASDVYGWGIDISEVARIWRAGCIIRARLLERIRGEYAAQDLTTLLEAPGIRAGLTEAQDGWRRVVGAAARAGVPTPGFSAALAYYDTLRAERLPAALVQGQRDYFGAHTYRRVDDEGAFHTDWSGDRSELRV
ncbi:NADP-dependent phosphogluconate dehydrogenase [Ornithinimicrobium pekingense]|uniref:6-phosphogluconate dehydrogenase, decarboxylating n=1 Tax=Ornithinimicrobium pekingense TaxID=384677 RepID=A0ABQ2F7Z8_9MICO|nr:NADP-dependent phosphogluconate dehydrogenase [Ornithinimicrobium pekingense]GGK62169.1 6-phosphogluconate dehydrogenase, decarboxylating [Ornithinimicrobium pekingense]